MKIQVGSRVVPCRWMDGQTDKTKLIVTFHKFAIHLKMEKMNVKEEGEGKGKEENEDVKYTK